MLRWWRKQLDVRAFLVFQRLRRFNQTFIVLAALVSGLDIGALSYQEFRSRDEHDASLNRTAEGFLCSSAITAVISALIAGMLLFQFEGLEKASRLELAVAWIPLTLMDLAIVEFLIGITCWYAANNIGWRGALMATQLTALLGLCIALSAFMWLSMKKKGGLGEEERKVTAAERRGVDGDREEVARDTESWLGQMPAKSQTNQVHRQEAGAENAFREGKPRARRLISIKSDVIDAEAVPSTQAVKRVETT